MSEETSSSLRTTTEPTKNIAATSITTAPTEKAVHQNNNAPSLKRPRRTICIRCDRPERTCLCAAIPATPLSLQRTHCLILQHPYELKRKNRSLPLVELCLAKEHVTVEVSRRLHTEVSPLFLERLRNPNSHVWLIFPSEEAISLQEAIQRLDDDQQANQSTMNPGSSSENDKVRVEAADSSSPKNITIKTDEPQPKPLVTLLFLDGTWQFAKEMDLYNTQREKYPAHLQRVQLSPSDLQSLQRPKRFAAIRTPPSEQHLSTAEALAWVVSKVEGDTSIYETLMKPLDLMVELHQSFMEENKHRPKRQKVKGPKPKKNAIGGQSTKTE